MGRRSASVTGEREVRIGFDIGGSKLAVIALGDDGTEFARDRCPVPRAYGATLEALVAMTASGGDRPSRHDWRRW
jgi:predicted NBD/HSP70 family sugar kinase